MKQFDPAFIEVMKQLILIATPMKNFNGYPPCPWLALGLGKAKVLIERGSTPTYDTDRAQQTLRQTPLWGIVYYYDETLHHQDLEKAYRECDTNPDYPHTVLYMHRAVADNPRGVQLAGKHPLLIVQDSDMLNYARDNLPPDYPYKR